MKFTGNAIKYGDNVDTDVIIPARYLNTIDKKELASHCMEDIDKEFVNKVREGDIMIAGSTQVTTYPALVPAALKSTYWGNERKDELFKQLNLEPIGSENSHKLWNELVDLWVEDASIVCLFTFNEPYVGAPGLNLNNPAMFFAAFYDAYWDNPSEHMD